MDNNNIQSDTNPTGHQAPGTFYIQTPELGKSLNQMLQLSQAGVGNIMTTGPKGSGKTRLLQRYLHQADKSWHVAVVHGETRLAPKQCLQLIAESANLPTDCGEVALIHLIADFTNNLVNTGKTPIICVDDIDLLPANTVQLLVQLASESGNNTAPWRLVMFADSDSSHNTELIPEHSPSGFSLTSQRMPAMDPAQAASFITQLDQHTPGHRDLSDLQARLGEENTPDDCIRLYMKLPVLQPVPVTRPREADLKPEQPQARKRKTGVRGYIIGFVGAFIIAAVLLFQDDINRLFTPVSTGPDYIPTDPSIVRKQLARLAQQQAAKKAARTAPVQTPGPAPVKQPPVAKTSPALSPVPAPAKPTPAVKKPSPVQPAPPVKLPAAAPAKPIKPPVITTRPAKPLPPAKTTAKPVPSPVTTKPATKPVPRAPRKKVVADTTRTWLLQQPANHFTLQLMGSNNPDTIRKFMLRYKTVKSLRTYHYPRNNKTWHVVISGSYPDRTRARTAISKLPATLRKQKPWLKKFGTIHQELQRKSR